MNVLSSISRRHGFSVVSRVMLERPRDYLQDLQDLLDLGCEPEDLGIVTYNPITHRVDVSALKHCKIGGQIYLLGPKADQEKVKKMLRDQGYKGRIG